MKSYKDFEFPPELQIEEKKALKLEWLTLFYLFSTAILVYLTMGNSQSMKTAYFEDLVSMIPAVSFLVASRLKLKSASNEFPYGFHRVVSIAFLTGALALFSIGVYLLVDSSSKLIAGEHVTIGVIRFLGYDLWLGYLMIPTMIWGIFPAYLLGKKKIPIAKKLHDKNLLTDAKMNKADWMTASGTIIGVIGIGFGLWWADGLAACLISLDIIHDGSKNLKQAVFDLMDETPKTVSGDKVDPLVHKIQSLIQQENWISQSEIRLREEGHIYVGEGFIVPINEDHLIDHLEDLSHKIQNLDWRLHDFTLIPVHQFKDLAPNLPLILYT